MTIKIKPNKDHGLLVDAEQIDRYFTRLFQHVDWGAHTVSLLGIGEKGTEQEGVFRERKFGLKQATDHCRRWAEHNAASFCVPAVLHASAQLSGDVKVDKVALFTAMILDLDSGDIPAKLEYVTKMIGTPSMVVSSGGSDKRHVYWMLDEPSDDIEHLAALRKELARKVGGDQAFGRATQVIRIPGSVHLKGGKPSRCEILVEAPIEYSAFDLEERIRDMPAMEGVTEIVTPALPLLTGGMMDFCAGAGLSQHTVLDTMKQTVTEGGNDERNRWSSFNEVAGHYIHQIRIGNMQPEEAFHATAGWMKAHMDPPWPQARLESEFGALLKKDVAEKGQFVPVPAATPVGQGIAPAEKIDTTEELLSWAVNLRSSSEAPARRVLIDGYLFAAKRHMMVAEGGAGKTLLCMELALKLAAASEAQPQTWMGSLVTPEAYGGTVILMTGEDDAEELDIRWNAIDPDGRLRAAAGDRLIALPLDNLGGAFPLVATHPATREAIASARWSALYHAIHGIKERGGKISAVIIDTLNSTLHGEENSAAIIGEYIRAISPIPGELGAAVVLTHHVRKPGNDPIKTLDDMRAAIRGSTALTNAMRIVIGAWPAHDYDRRMKAMGLKPERGTLFRLGIVKANIPEASRDIKTLLRQPSGLLADVSSTDVIARGPSAEQEAWLTFSIREAADRRAIFSRTGANGLFARRSQLHPILEGLSRAELDNLSQTMLQDGRLVLRPVDNGGKEHKYLDVPENAKVTRYIDTTATLTIDYSQWYYDHGRDSIRSAFEGD